MPDPALRCYLDEFGSYGFDFTKRDVSSHFIVGGPIVVVDACYELTVSVDAVAQKYVGGGVLKSKNIGNNDERRLAILRSLFQLDFHIFALVVDKRQIQDGAIRNYKRSFIKYLNSLAFDELYLHFPRLAIYSDEIGDKAFMNGFVKYVNKKHLAKDVFGHAEFDFQEDTSNRLTQLADFLVGTLARFYDVTKRSLRANEIMESFLQSGKLLPVSQWPKSSTRYFQTNTIPGFENVVGKADAVIEEQSLRSAQRFLEEAKDSADEYIREQVASLNYMLHVLGYDDPTRYISTQEFIKHLSLYPDMLQEKKPFGRCVMDRMRDAGVLISSNNKGYKLVVNARDLDQFVKYYDSFIGPMLKRLRIYRNKIRLATQNELDILNAKKYEYLKSFFDKDEVQ